MNKRVATLILNRNLPDLADKLFDHFVKYDSAFTDIYIIEAGSDDDKLSQNFTWHANWEDARLNGLRYARGMNFGLSQLWKEKKFSDYEAFFLVCNDIEFSQSSSIDRMLSIFEKHPRLGILSPCSSNWGELLLLNNQTTKYFWFIHNNAYFIRKEFIEDICNPNDANYMHFLFDGTNFRGYGLEHELITKGYINDWASAITRDVMANENESYLINKSDLIKTEPYSKNLELYIEEGKEWMKKKYGFKSHWSMQRYSKSFYDLFFESHPEYKNYQL
tara:strand:+ start:3251 stop:4078 length:828 start_codon:yes stop_codon:yes gene_type:complete